MTLLRSFARFWYDFLVGDDWTIACEVVGVLGVGAVIVRLVDYNAHVLTAGLALVVMGLFAVSLLRGARRGDE